MGGGNGAKAATRRARQMEQSNKPAAGSQLKNNQASQTIVCKLCLQTFVCTTTEKVLRDHFDNRHPKGDFAQAFPHLAK